MEMDLNNYLPPSYEPFIPILDLLTLYSPNAIAIVGSYGDFSKTPTILSDVDMIYIFETDFIIKILNCYIEELSRINELQFYYLGVTFQFGHTISMNFKDNPIMWLDLGIMDMNYSMNYLVDLPMKVISGKVNTCGIPPSPINQMHHLAKKIIKANMQNRHQNVLVLCYRYLGWWRIQYEMLERYISIRKDNIPSNELEVEYFKRVNSEIGKNYINSNLFMESEKIIKMVYSDIEIYFPYLFNKLINIHSFPAN